MDFHRLQELFLASLSKLPSNSLPSVFNLMGMAEISYAMDLCPLQESFRFRARYLGWSAARWLIDETGEIDLVRVNTLRGMLEKSLYPLGPRMEGDAEIYAHLLLCLNDLAEKKELSVLLKKFSLPLCHKKAEEIVRETIWPDEENRIGSVHVKRAALTAWLTLLRQTTGSCFATAPAILVQRYQPERFFKDLYDLLSIGQLRRTFEGKGYTVPFSPTPGMGDLQKTLSSFPNAEAMAYAPGLRISLDAAEFFPFDMPLGQKIGDLRRRLSRIDTPVETPEKLFKILMLDGLGLTEEEIADEENLAKIQMTPLLAKQSAVYYQRPSERGKKVAEYKKKLAKACATFRALTECTLLRTWEYTIASFCDVKVDFARWNLYVGLGLHPDQKGGVGDFLYQIINGKLQAKNEEAARLHREYEASFSSVRAIEVLLRQAGSEGQIHQLKGQLSSAMHESNLAEQMRDRAVAAAEALSNSFSSLIRQYDEKLQDHFQEIFDPSVRALEAHQYEDSPAGFRLVYKHGRSDASLWTMIHTEDEYLNSLRDFFSTVERDLIVAEPLGAEFAAEVTTEIVRYLFEPEFIISAKERSRVQGRASPWDYVSGGTMQMMVQHYYGRTKPLTETSFTPRSEEELAKFLKTVAEGTTGPLLIHSPSHAFILMPDWIQLQSEANSVKNLQAIKRWKLDEEMQEHLAHRLSDRLNPLEKPLFLHLFRQKFAAETNKQFRLRLIETLKSIPESRLKNPVEAVDSLLYENFPLFKSAEATIALETILRPLLGSQKIEIQIDANFIGAFELQQKAKEEILRLGTAAFSSTDWDMEIATRARMANLSYPAPYLFADTNWAGWYFGWVINPASGEWELWRLNRTATQGIPMSEWKGFFSPQNRLPWVLLPVKKEYFLL